VVEGVIDADPIAAAVRAVMAARKEWTGTASELLDALAETAGERVAKSKAWPDSPRALGGRLRRAATFLRKIGIEIGFGREGRARTRTIHIATTPSRPTPENIGVQPSASSAPSASMPQSNPVNGFAAPPPRTVAHDADGSGRGNAPTVCALKTNAGTAADGADANRPPQSAPEKAGAPGLEVAAMSAIEALKAARAAGIRLGIDGKDLTLEAAAAPPPGVLHLLSLHKAGIVALLRSARRSSTNEAASPSSTAASRVRGPRFRLVHRRMAQPQSGALATRRAEADRLHLSNRVRFGGGYWEDVAKSVPIVRARPAASAVRRRISSAPAWGTGSPAAGASPSCTGRVNP
jgi:hypothetical protein